MYKCKIGAVRDRRSRKRSRNEAANGWYFDETKKKSLVEYRSRLNRQAMALRKIARENEQKADELLAEVAEIDEAIRQLRQS